MTVVRHRVLPVILPVIVALIAAFTLTACGGDDSKVADKPTAKDTSKPAPDFQQLSEKQLKGALLTIEDLPSGYSQDPPSEASGPNYCDYVPVVEPNTTVERGFTRGSGFSGEYLSVEIRQFDSPEAAAKRFEQTRDVVKKCRKETKDGATTIRTLMSAPDVGYNAFGVKTTSNDTVDTFKNYVLVGPSIVSVGGFGIRGVDMEGLSLTTRKQTDRYQDTSKGVFAP